MKPHHALGPFLSIALMTLSLGCEDKKAKTTPANVAGPAADAEAQAVAGLDTQQDVAHCRTVLAQLDNLPSVSSRPTLSATDADSIRQLLQLTPADSNEISQATFSQTDGAYLEDCLLLRAGIRSLRLESRSPLEQAVAAFEWVCRLVYVDNRIPWPSPVGMTLRAGYGVAASRAYVTLAAWQQVGMDSCLIGPPSLKTAASFSPPTQPGAKPTYAPVRICGVRIDKDVYLFDASSGKAIAASDGKGVMTLAQAKAAPEGVAGYKADEVKSWQIYMAPALSSLSKRMEWLQAMNPANMKVQLYIDLPKLKASFQGAAGSTTIDGWNPTGDRFTATRVQPMFVSEEDLPEKRAHRELYQHLVVPMEIMPDLGLEGQPLHYLRYNFAQPFQSMMFGPQSPRSLLIRGQFQDATSNLEDLKTRVDNARVRIEKDPDIAKDVAKWAGELRAVFADTLRSRGNSLDVTAAANKAFEDFAKQPRNRDLQSAFIWGSASRPLGAAVDYLMAECVHERAERAQRDSSGQALAHWKNAEEWWGRFLDSSSQAGLLPAREAHAKILLERCRQFTTK